MLLLLNSISVFSQNGNSHDPLGVKPGIIVNGLGCKIKNQQFSCVPRYCDSLVITQGDSVSFCTDAEVDLISDSLYYMQWNFNGSANYPTPIFNNAPSQTPVCYNPTWNVAGDYVVDAYYNGWLSAYPSSDCYVQGPSHWIVKVKVLPLTDVLNMEDKHALLFYPNPANDHITVSSVLFNTNENWEYRIFDLPGAEVLSGSVRKESNLIDVSGLPEGLYFISIRADSISFTKKMVVE
jgi:hypothetical protein